MTPVTKKKNAATRGKKTPRKTAAKKKAPSPAKTTKARPAKKKTVAAKAKKKAETTKAKKKAAPTKAKKKAVATKAKKKAVATKAKKKPVPAKAKKKADTAKKKTSAAKAKKTAAPTKGKKKAETTKAGGRGTPRRRSRQKAPQVPAVDILPRRAPIAAAEGSGKLGTKWDCYSCDAKFYDLNKEEPICPKCGASQHDAPRVDRRAKLSASRQARKTRTRRRMSPLLDDEDDASYVQNQDLDLGIAANRSDDEEFVDARPETVSEEEDDDDET